MSFRKAINAKCKECIYDPVSGAGTWRQQVEACTAKTCPLWALRAKAADGITVGLESLENSKTGRFDATVNTNLNGEVIRDEDEEAG